MQISIKYVNFPRPGGKYGSIIGQDGFKIRVPPDLLDQFRAGQTVEVNTKEQLWYRGTPQEEVATIATGGPTGTVQRQGASTGYQHPNQQGSAYRSNTGFRPRVVEGGPAPLPQADQTRWNFIMGLTGRWGGSGKYAISEMRVLGHEAAALYDELNKPAPPPRTQTQPAPDRGYFPATGEPPLDMEPGDPGPQEGPGP